MRGKNDLPEGLECGGSYKHPSVNVRSAYDEFVSSLPTISSPKMVHLPPMHGFHPEWYTLVSCSLSESSILGSTFSPKRLSHTYMSLGVPSWQFLFLLEMMIMLLPSAGPSNDRVAQLCLRPIPCGYLLQSNPLGQSCRAFVAGEKST